jgi:hypothetical protein
MKKILAASVIAGLGFGMIGTATAQELGPYAKWRTTIDQRQGSAVNGEAVFAPQGNGKMEIRVEVSNADGLSAGIHTGICRFANGGDGNAPEHLAFSENPVVELADVSGGESITTADLTIEELMTGPHSIAIEDGDTVVACGNIQ